MTFDPQFKLPPKQEFMSRLKTLSQEENTDDLIDRSIEMRSERCEYRWDTFVFGMRYKIVEDFEAAVEKSLQHRAPHAVP